MCTSPIQRVTLTEKIGSIESFLKRMRSTLKMYIKFVSPCGEQCRKSRIFTKFGAEFFSEEKLFWNARWFYEFTTNIQKLYNTFIMLSPLMRWVHQKSCALLLFSVGSEIDIAYLFVGNLLLHHSAWGMLWTLCFL